MLDKEGKKQDNNLRNNINQRKLKGGYYILNDINEIFTLIQLMDIVGGVNHTVSIFRKMKIQLKL